MGKGNMERISVHQFITLGAGVLLGTTFLPIATVVTEIGGRGGWVSILPGFAAGVPYALMVFSLMEKYPGKNLIEISEILFGKWLGKLIGIIFVVITTYLGGLLVAQIGDIYEVAVMPLTPIGVFHLGGIVLVYFLIRSGIEVFARFAEIIFPFIVIALALNIGLSIPRIEHGELLPLLGNGLFSIILGVPKVIPFVMTYILFLAVIIPFLPTGKRELPKLKRGVWRVIFLVGILDTLIVLIQILVFGPTETIRLVYGFLTLGKMVEISRTVAGVESLFLGVWLGAAVIKITALFFSTIWGLDTIFRLNGIKWRVLTAVVLLTIACKFVRGPAMIIELGIVDQYLTMPFVMLWIPILWGISHWKKSAGT
ncbi:Spore germination protein [Desulfosporosinus orientis DSM 765]|uniref:Spore germination protein n=2 Tax=Desulfosporosinus orientis TaxID=1563 RepID=G7W7B6_DESOD|nr:Spore germination protein [Desulfosporosinus orientis DSM 765]